MTTLILLAASLFRQHTPNRFEDPIFFERPPPFFFSAFLECNRFAVFVDQFSSWGEGEAPRGVLV
jgi:hypothetical protein